MKKTLVLMCGLLTMGGALAQTKVVCHLNEGVTEVAQVTRLQAREDCVDLRP